MLFDTKTFLAVGAFAAVALASPEAAPAPTPAPMPMPQTAEQWDNFNSQIQSYLDEIMTDPVLESIASEIGNDEDAISSVSAALSSMGSLLVNLETPGPDFYDAVPTVAQSALQSIFSVEASIAAENGIDIGPLPTGGSGDDGEDDGGDDNAENNNGGDGENAAAANGKSIGVAAGVLASFLAAVMML